MTAEKDNTTMLELLSDPDDEEGIHFTEVYGRPMYVIHNMTGMPSSLMRLNYPDDGDEYLNINHPNSTGLGTNDTKDLAPHKHYHPDFFHR